MTVRLVKLLVSLLVLGADKLWAAVNAIIGRPRATKCVVLYYHAIRGEWNKRFAAQMDDLQRLSTPIDILDNAPLKSGVRYSAVTFDDGFVSVVKNALPALKSRNIPCAIFIPTGSLGRRPSWIPASHADGAETVLDADAMRVIASERFTRIASHSVSHPDFRRLDDERARHEFIESKATIERISGCPVDSFSFPHGAHTVRSIELARECGYTRLFTIEPLQLGDPRSVSVIGRVRVEPDDWPLEFRLKVLGAYRWMPHASRLKQGLRRMMGKKSAPEPLRGV